MQRWHGLNSTAHHTQLYWHMVAPGWILLWVQACQKGKPMDLRSLPLSPCSMVRGATESAVKREYTWCTLSKFRMYWYSGLVGAIVRNLFAINFYNKWTNITSIIHIVAFSTRENPREDTNRFSKSKVEVSRITRMPGSRPPGVLGQPRGVCKGHWW